MRVIERQIEIEAPPAAVWAVLADTETYPEWNPFITSLEGPLERDARLSVRIAPPGGRPMSFRPTVLEAAPERELRWLGRVVAPGLFDGEHSFRLEPLDGGRTRFVQSERFTGALVGVFGGSLRKTERGFEQMNEALKARVESRS